MQRTKSKVTLYAPDCKTMTRAREIPIPGMARPPVKMRSEEEPKGLASWRGVPKVQRKIELGNAVATSTLQWCKEDHTGLRGFLLENPENAYLWWFPEAEELLKLEDKPEAGLVTPYDVLLDNCMGGGERKKGSRFRTNIPAAALALPGRCGGTATGVCDRTGVRHLSLRPQVYAAGVAFPTEKEAEYPAGLCEGIAKLVASHTSKFPPSAGGLHFTEVFAGPNAPTTAAVLRTPLPVAASAPAMPKLTLAGRWGNTLVREDRLRPEELGLSAARQEKGPEPRKVTRERENRNCVGGMRSPWRAIKRMPSMAAAGQVVTEVLDRAMHVDAYWSKLSQQLGNSSFAERGSESDTLLQDKLQPLRKDLMAALGYTGGRRTFRHTLWNAGVADAWSLAAHDPDRVFVEWLEKGCPGGAAVAVEDGGIFPQVKPEDGEARKLEEFTALHEPCSNYMSVEEARAKAGGEVDRAIERGYATFYSTWQELKSALGDVIVSKLACIIKEKPDGSEKVRIVVDLTRSGYNLCVLASERLVLPRFKDLVENALCLKAAAGASDSTKFLTVDFEDAFCSLGLREEEERHLCAKHPVQGFISYKTVLFGGAMFPVVWGRGSAFAGRSAQSMLDSTNGRVEIYVDDPCVTLTGTEQEIERSVTHLLMWWLALGLRVAWGKGSLGAATAWIGANIDASLPGVVKASIPEKFAREVHRLLSEMRVVDPRLEQVRTLAGKLSFAASIVPVVWAHVACLWAAMADTEASVRKRPAPGNAAHQPWLLKTARVGNKKIRHAVEWLLLLFSKPDCLTRTYHVQHHWRTPRVSVTMDASPWGGGAVLAIEGAPVAWLTTRWDELDEANVSASVGSCTGQATWEALVILVAVRAWMPVWRQEKGAILLKSDAKAAIGAAEKLRSVRSAGLNRIMAELALTRAEANYEFEFRFAHIPGVLNVAADALSRLRQPESPASFPPELKGLPEKRCEARDSEWWRTPTDYAYRPVEGPVA